MIRYVLPIILAIFAGQVSAQRQVEGVDPVVRSLAMSDGAELNTYVYFPTVGSAPYDTLLLRSLQGVDNIILRPEPVLAEGFVLVYQDTRGTGASDGTFRVHFDDGFGPDNQDGAETIEWIRDQTWSTGNVAMIGGSAEGINQYFAASADPPGLGAMYVQVGAANLYQDLFYTNGAFRRNLGENWPFDPAGSPSFATDFLQNEVFNRPLYTDEFWGFLNVLPRLETSTVPTVHRTGWYDAFIESSIDAFQVMQEASDAEPGPNTQRLIIEAYGHAINNSPSQWGLFIESFPDPKNDPGINDSPVDSPAGYESEPGWAKRWLTGEDQGWDNQGLISYFLLGSLDDVSGDLGNVWRWSDTWPPAGYEQEYFLSPDDTLQESSINLPSSSSNTTYTYDPSNPVPTRGGRHIFLTDQQGPQLQGDIIGRSDVLTFTSSVFNQAREIAGPVRVKLWVSSSAVDTDFSAKLCVVYTDGRIYNMVDSLMPMRHRNTTRAAELVTPGTIVPVEFELGNIAWAVNEGERLMLQISSSNYPSFDINPNTGALPFEETTPIPADNTIYHSKEFPSVLTIPFRGALPNVDDGFRIF